MKDMLDKIIQIERKYLELGEKIDELGKIRDEIGNKLKSPKVIFLCACTS